MKVLVTGATSGLGRHAVEELLRQGHLPRATGRDATAGRQVQALGAAFEFADLATATPARARELVDGVDVVWHCAALSSPWGRRRDFEAANVRATRLLAEAAVDCGVPRFVQVSTPSIYFDYRHHADVPEGYRARRHANAYAASKARAEGVIASLAARRPRTCFAVLRPRALFGPHDRVILPRVLALYRRHRGALPLPGGGRARMDFTYVGNMVHAMGLASTATGFESGAAFNITNQEPTTLADLLHELLVDRWKLVLRVRDVPYPALAAVARLLEARALFTRREPMLTRYGVAALHYGMTLDNRKSQQQLGYFAPVPMHDALARTADWHRAHGHHLGF